MELLEEEDPWKYMEIERLTPGQLEVLLSDGWRHFGTFFFRDKVSWNNGRMSPVIPLRVNVHTFSPSKSQRKILRKNTEAKVEVVFREAAITAEKEDIFHAHCKRFKDNVPSSIYDFLDRNPAKVPCGCTQECALYLDGKLFGISFIDVTPTALSSIYAMFLPEYATLSPGLYTLLMEIEYALKTGKDYVYTGYSFAENSHYDYKKKFKGTEFYDWQGVWRPLEHLPMS